MSQWALGPQFIQQRFGFREVVVVEFGTLEQGPPTFRNFLFGQQWSPLAERPSVLFPLPLLYSIKQLSQEHRFGVVALKQAQRKPARVFTIAKSLIGFPLGFAPPRDDPRHRAFSHRK